MSQSHSDHRLPAPAQVKALIQHVHAVCPFGSTNKINPKKVLTRNALSVFAFAVTKKGSPSEDEKAHQLFDATASDSLTYCNYFTRHKKEPKTPKDRIAFLRGLASITKVLSYNYGFGNCEHMADLAFFEAVMQNFNCGIHYIRFDHATNPFLEELNVLVLGNWPQPGCLIISPWEGDQGKSYEWQGDCRATKSLANQNYNRARSLFSISVEDPYQEKYFIRSMLNKANYSSWLHDKTRVSKFTLIRNSFLAQVHQADFLKKSHWGYSTYQDLTRWGLTSANNYKKLESIKEELNKDKAVQAITRMPK